MKRLFGLLAVLLMGTTLAAGQGGDNLVAGKGEQKVVAVGMGSTSEDATKDALRSAVEIAVGSMVSSTTLIEGDNIIRDEILNLSHGFVRTYNVIAQSGSARSGYSVTVSAIVTREHLAEKLKAKGVSVNYNAGAMFAKLKEWDNQAAAERAMAKNLFGLEAMKARGCNVYDYELEAQDPVRENNKYKVTISRKATKNHNWEIEYQRIKTTLDQLCYEKCVLRPKRMIREINAIMTSYGGRLYSQTIAEGYDINGEPLNIERDVAVERQNRPKPYNTVQNGHNAYGGYQTTADMTFIGGSNISGGTNQHSAFEYTLTDQDRSRLHSEHFNYSKVYNLFEHSFTPYVYVLYEDSEGDGIYDNIIIYKFTHPDTAGFVHRYASWLFSEFHHTILFEYPTGNKRSKANLNIPCTGKFTGKSLIKGMSISGYDTYKGYWLTYSPTATVSFHNTWTLSEQQFSTLMGLTVEPTNDTAEVEQFIRNFKLE